MRLKGKTGTTANNYRKRQRNTSIYFLLWAAFSAFALIIVLTLGFSQRVVMTQTYKTQTVRDLAQKGREIQLVLGKESQAEGEKDRLIRTLSSYYDVEVFVLTETGEVVLPHPPENQSNQEFEELFDFSQKIVVLKNELEKTQETFVIYEGEEEYVYGSKIELYEDFEVYLYIAKSLRLMNAATKQMTTRLWLIAGFTFLLSFAVSSAVSGWLTRPISEMTKKARKLARGDFDVDFHGNDYGQEMVELADTLNFARDELSKTDKMQKELIANVSHDFKTPLTMIKAYASMIKEISGDNKQKREQHAQVIVDEADRLTSLVSDVLDLSKMRAGIDELKITTVDMSVYLDEILGRFDYLCETQGYRFEVDIQDGLFTQADELKIGQALYNLIGNAVNYTGENKTVYVQLRKQSQSEFRFMVKDTGAGISKDELADIWERYYRSKETHKRPVQGTGLGLSIVKTIFEKHGFKYGVESGEGIGSTFYVDFPLKSLDKDV